MFGGVVGGRRCEGATAAVRDEAVNVDALHIAGQGDEEVVRRAVGPEAGRVSGRDTCCRLSDQTSSIRKSSISWRVEHRARDSSPLLVAGGTFARLSATFSRGPVLRSGVSSEVRPWIGKSGTEVPNGDTMATVTFQKGDRVVFKEFPEVVEGQIVEFWKRGFYKVAWNSGPTYQGKTTIVSGNVIRKKAG